MYFICLHVYTEGSNNGYVGLMYKPNKEFFKDFTIYCINISKHIRLENEGLV